MSKKFSAARALLRALAIGSQFCIDKRRLKLCDLCPLGIKIGLEWTALEQVERGQSHRFAVPPKA